MKALVDSLFPNGAPKDSEFTPRARYFGPIDAMVYVREDVSYRADRVDPFLTVLWHPTEERLVGVKLKGFRFLFDRLSATLSATVPAFKTENFLPFIQALEMAFTAGVGEVLTYGVEWARLREGKYQQAREFVKDVSIPEDEFKKAA